MVGEALGRWGLLPPSETH